MSVEIAVLHELGQFLQNSTRGEDITCCYGGEEFVMILVKATLEGTCKNQKKSVKISG